MSAAHLDIWDHVTIPEVQGPLSCWPFTGPKDAKGYGRFRGQQAHRITYEAIWGPIPAGHDVAHDCGDLRALLGMDPTPSRGCVNPMHLRAATRRDNLLSSPITEASRNRAKTSCPQGHPLADWNNTNSKRRIGQRECALCKTVRDSLRSRSRS